MGSVGIWRGNSCSFPASWRDLFGRVWQPARLHLAVVVAALSAFVYLPTHLVLSRLLRSRWLAAGASGA